MTRFRTVATRGQGFQREVSPLVPPELRPTAPHGAPPGDYHAGRHCSCARARHPGAAVAEAVLAGPRTVPRAQERGPGPVARYRQKSGAGENRRPVRADALCLTATSHGSGRAAPATKSRHCCRPLHIPDRSEAPLSASGPTARAGSAYLREPPMKSRDPASLRAQPTRNGVDFWATPRCLTDALVRCVLPSLPPTAVWECAAGDGRLAAALRAAGRTVFASDLMPAASGIQCIDFLLDAPPASVHGAVIATNPPFNRLAEFVCRGLSLLDRGVATALILLLRSDALTADGRAAALNRATSQWTCCWRPVWLAGTKGGGRWSNAWIVWRAGHGGPAAAHYLRRADVVVGDLLSVTGGENHAEP
jgi:hypothetical protein